jgi:hypothetical protein
MNIQDVLGKWWQQHPCWSAAVLFVALLALG